jgi:hypothetical protein
MYGDPVFRFTVNTTTGANEDDGLFTVDRNGKLRGDHQYISALAFVRHRERAADFYNELAARDEHLSRDERLAAIHEAADSGRVPEGTYLCMDVFRTMSPTAVPLPDVFFDGPHDRLFDHDPTDEVYRQVRGPRGSRRTAGGWGMAAQRASTCALAAANSASVSAPWLCSSASLASCSTCPASSAGAAFAAGAAERACQ